MGGFYGSVQVRGDDRAAIRPILSKLARRKRRFLVGPPLGGWIGIYPDGGGQDLELGREIARRLGGEAMTLLVHDDDFLLYEYHRDGDLVDRYNSVPDYFGAVSAEERHAQRGRPETFAHLAVDPEPFARLAGRLAAQAEDRDVFAHVLLEEFAAALGIRNAVTSYEYMRENEETDDIEGRDDFIHVPKIDPERARQQAEEAAIAAAKRPLIEQALLLAERGGRVTPSPWFCPSPDGRGFVVAWSNHADPAEGSLPVESHGPPWSVGPTPTPWSIGSRVFGLALSPTGRFLAVAHAAGAWEASVWDLGANRLVAEVPQVRAVTDVGFTPDESAMVSASSHGEEGRVVVTPIGPGESRTFPIDHAKLVACHPAGSHLVVADNLGRLLVVDMATGRVERTRLVGGRRQATAPERQVAAQIQQVVAQIDPDVWEQQVRRQMAKMLAGAAGSSGAEAMETMQRQLDEQIAKMRATLTGGPLWRPTQDRGSEIVFRARFHPADDRLCLATSGGVRVYEWRDIMAADGDLPPGPLAVDVEISADYSSNRQGYIYDLDFDSGRDRLLFGGLDGRIRFLDLASGRSGVLLEPPGLPPILRMALTRDRTALCLTVYPDLHSRGRNKRGHVLQFWDYEAISRTS